MLIFGGNKNLNWAQASASCVGGLNQLFLIAAKRSRWQRTGPMGIYEVKRSQRHLLADIGNNWFGVLIIFFEELSAEFFPYPLIQRIFIKSKLQKSAILKMPCKNINLPYFIHMYWTIFWLFMYSTKVSKKLVTHIFTLLVTPFASKLVHYSRHSESF